MTRFAVSLMDRNRSGMAAVCRVIEKGGRALLDLPRIFDRFRIVPDGVLHVGAHIGQEEATYRQMRFRHRLFVEAQPGTFKRLKGNL
jgi:hypothetical protein